MANLVESQSSNDVLRTKVGGRIILDGGKLQASGNVDLIPPPIATPDGYVLTSNASAPGKVDWEAGGGGASTLAALTDVTLTSPQEGDLLRYDGTVWRNVPGGAPTLLTLQVPLDPWKIDQMCGSTLGVLAWRRYQDGVACEIYSYDMSSATTTLVATDGSTHNDESATPEVDQLTGTRVAYSCPDGKLRIRNLDGSGLVASQTFDAPPRYPSWRPTGVACIAQVSGTWGIYDVDPATGAATAVIADIGANGNNAWLRCNGLNVGELAYSDGDGAWYTAQPNGSSPVTMAGFVQDNTSKRVDWIFSGDGTILVVTGRELRAVSPNNGGTTNQLLYAAQSGETIRHPRYADTPPSAVFELVNLLGVEAIVAVAIDATATSPTRIVPDVGFSRSLFAYEPEAVDFGGGGYVLFGYESPALDAVGLIQIL